MTTQPFNRMAQPEVRKVGRPANGSDRHSAQDAVIDTTQRKVPPVIPPCCGRGNQPTTERWEVSGVHAGHASCVCGACGRGFYYAPGSPAKITLK